jgi:hypothetical protein
MMAPAEAIVIVTPIFEDMQAASRLFFELRKVLGAEVRIVAVDDGSVRQRVMPDAISAAGLEGVVIRLRRNVGHQRAISVGVDYVATHFPNATCVIMDSDGEDVPATIPELLILLANQEVDVVVAGRKSRVETVRFKLFYLVYKFLFQTMTGRMISFGNFMALKPGGVKRLSAMSELGTHVAACVLISRLRTTLQPINRGPRYAGKSKMNFSGLVLHGFRAFTVLAEDVLVRMGIACACVAALCLFGIVVSLSLKLIGMATPGWTSTVFGLLTLVLLQTGILTLMLLMLTGVSRGNYVQPNYVGLIDEIVSSTSVRDEIPT